jgi:predicted nucleic acid-binding protein
LFEINPLTRRAVEIALESGVIVYDVLFLALAEDAVTVVVTADDNRLLRVLHDTSYGRLAHPLAGVDSLIPGAC